MTPPVSHPTRVVPITKSWEILHMLDREHVGGNYLLQHTVTVASQAAF